MYNITPNVAITAVMAIAVMTFTAIIVIKAIIIIVFKIVIYIYIETIMVNTVIMDITVTQLLEQAFILKWSLWEVFGPQLITSFVSFTQEQLTHLISVPPLCLEPSKKFVMVVVSGGWCVGVLM